MEQSRGGDTKIVKKGAKLGKGVGALKKGGCSLLSNYGWFNIANPFYFNFREVVFHLDQDQNFVQ